MVGKGRQNKNKLQLERPRAKIELSLWGRVFRYNVDTRRLSRKVAFHNEAELISVSYEIVPNNLCILYVQKEPGSEWAPKMATSTYPTLRGSLTAITYVVQYPTASGSLFKGSFQA